MTWTSLDRWTCPTCRHTFVADGLEVDIVAALRAVRDRHGEQHGEMARLRNTSVDNPAPRWGAA